MAEIRGRVCYISFNFYIEFVMPCRSVDIAQSYPFPFPLKKCHTAFTLLSLTCITVEETFIRSTLIFKLHCVCWMSCMNHLLLYLRGLTFKFLQKVGRKWIFSEQTVLLLFKLFVFKIYTLLHPFKPTLETVFLL